ncbi:MAG: peptidoglycan editing factor PgeF [Chromatiales bacterium]|nr:peptidoglycan editing factor PgeF [Chromatiales bacterium]MDX9767097.1 peptidoglycan editing factor PgeF [Ectothiorhodospiraceae bacterium]
MSGDFRHGPAAGWLRPDWPAPPGVRAVSTTRAGGVSGGPYASLNLGDHVDDDPAMVRQNRRILRETLALPAEPLWLSQVHGVRVVDAATAAPGAQADAAVAFEPGVVCTVMTADCLPVLFCDLEGTRVGVAHAGWRGLCDGVLEATVAALDCAPRRLLAWLGPAIGRAAFEVGDEVREAFRARDAGAGEAFRSSPNGHWLADIYALARRRLTACGVTAIYGGGLCTHDDAARFFSYRRERVTGRMASLIWLTDRA